MQTLFIVNISSDFLYDEVIKFFPLILLAYCNTHNYNRYTHDRYTNINFKENAKTSFSYRNQMLTTLNYEWNYSFCRRHNAKLSNITYFRW